MPLVEVLVPEGTLDAARRDVLIRELTATALKVEDVPDSAQARSLTWIFVDEVPKGSWAIGCEVPGDLRFLVRVSVPAGTLSVVRRRRMGLVMHKTLSTFAGKFLTPAEAWIIVYEIPEGHWTAGGKVLCLQDVSNFMGMKIPKRRQNRT